MRNVRFAALALVLAASLSASADEKSPGKGLVDADFVAKAASSGMAEIAINKIAQEKAKDDKVKQFAAKLVKDHTAAAEKLAAAAKEAGVPVPKAMMPEHEKAVMMFKDASGDFDAMYGKHMVESHMKSIELHTAAAKDLMHAPLKSYAEQTLPTLKEHLAGAKKIADEHSPKK